MTSSSRPAPVDMVITNSSQLLTMAPGLPATGKPEPRAIPNGAVAVRDGVVIATGTTAEIVRDYPCPDVIDAGNRLVMPGFVDCHTHLVHAGERTAEMEMRLRGSSYLDILNSGGGIHSTVRATREASSDELFSLGMERLDQMARNGTTTVEIKSGYGLNEETELKMLNVARRLSDEHRLDIVITYLGAHTVPSETDRDAYLRWLSGESLETFSDHAEFFDVFCEEGAFTLRETQSLLDRALEAGFKLKVHAGQFTALGAAGLAADRGARSADHLEHVSDAEVAAMARAGTTAVLLPGVPFFLQSADYPDARRFIDAGVPVALSTDFNPGSSPSYSMQMMITLGVFYCGLDINQALAAATLTAARAVDRHESTGSLEPGKKADIIILDATVPAGLPYHFGTNLVRMTIKDGVVIHSAG